MARRNPPEASLQSELSVLLDWLCVEWGFCIPPNDAERIAASTSLEAAEFATEVLKAEGFPSPEYEIEWSRKIKRRFVEHFGADSVSDKNYVGRGQL
jgi:hypothetical protein